MGPSDNWNSNNNSICVVQPMENWKIMKPTMISIDVETKRRLDIFKANNKNEIITKYSKERRMATNSDAIRFLLDNKDKEEKK